MQFYYGEKNILRALDEAEFWKHQEAEHTGLIPVVTPGLEKEYLQGLEWFGFEINRLYAEVIKYVASVVRSKGDVSHELRVKMVGVIKKCIEQSTAFVDYMEGMLQNSKAVKNSQVSQTVINHMIRESQYFIGIDQLMLGGV